MQNGRKSTENGHLPEPRENAGDQRPIALKFAPDWLKSWRDFQGQSQSTLRQERHHLIFDCNLLWVFRLLTGSRVRRRTLEWWMTFRLACFPFRRNNCRIVRDVNREVLFTKEKREVINKTLNSERSFDIIWYDFNVLSGKYFSRLYICHVFQTLRDKLSRKQWEITLAYFRYRGFRYPEKHNPSERRKAQKWKCMTLVTAPFSHGAGCQVFPPKQHVKRACFLSPI